MKKLYIPGLAIGALAAIVYSGSTSALTYQTSADVSFTFNPFITVSASDDLTINNLTPGSYADSNIITVGVTTNTLAGYVLQTTAGTNATNNRLTNTDNSSYYFSSLGTSETVATMNSASDNTWGYSYSVDNGTTWISAPNTLGYSGLPQDANTNANERGKGGKTLLDTDGTTGNQSVKFKIGAKAATTQAAGTYTNTINFYAVAYPEPEPEPEGLCASNQYVMQNVSTWGSSIASGNEVTACDSRDGQTYTVARLADGKLWMTENLNLAGGTALSADDTDVTSTYISSFTTSNNLTKDDTHNTIVLPASSTSGFDTDNYSYVYNSGNKTNCGASGQNTPCYSYYSWDAATLGSGRSISTGNTDAPYSICPKNWKLPSTYNGSGTAAAATDFRALMIGYGGSDSVQTYISSSTPTGATMYGNIGPGSTPNFLLAGYYYYGSFYDGGSYGYYWSSTSYSSTSFAWTLSFGSTSVDSAGSGSRSLGFSVRCLFSS